MFHVQISATVTMDGIPREIGMLINIDPYITAHTEDASYGKLIGEALNVMWDHPIHALIEDWSDLVIAPSYDGKLTGKLRDQFFLLTNACDDEMAACNKLGAINATV